MALPHRTFASAGNFARRGLGSPRHQHQPAGLGCARRIALGGDAGAWRHLRSSLFKKKSLVRLPKKNLERIERYTGLETDGFGCDSRAMKTLSIEQAQGQFKAICEEALNGEIIRLQLANGALLELTRVPVMPPALSAQELKECYEENDWAAFENHCAAASD